MNKLFNKKTTCSLHRQQTLISGSVSASGSSSSLSSESSQRRGREPFCWETVNDGKKRQQQKQPDLHYLAWWLADQHYIRYQCPNIGSSSLTDDPGREELLDSFPLFLLPLPCTGDATALRLPDGGLLAERGWDEVGGREPGNNNN